jgi:hypothetical protein
MTTQTLYLIDEYLTQGGYTQGIDTETLEREAHLVAAAPDLLAVICEMLGAAETDLLDDKSNVWRSAMISARAAIAKAEGADA